jgi:hypothetical protein
MDTVEMKITIAAIISICFLHNMSSGFNNEGYRFDPELKKIYQRWQKNDIDPVCRSYAELKVHKFDFL